MFARHCDYEDCDTWQRVITDQPQFITVTCPVTWKQPEFHFCSLDHVMRWSAANSVPTEVVSTEGN
jgi:hypothetical protein